MIDIIIKTVMNDHFIDGCIVGAFLIYYKVPITFPNVFHMLGMIVLNPVTVILLLVDKFIFEIKFVRNFIKYIGGTVK